MTSVCCDNVHGAHSIADHLRALGHRRVAYVAGETGTNTGEIRRNAFITSIAEFGLTLAANAVAGNYTYDAGCTALDVYRTSKPDAIFFANDVLAAAGMDALRDGEGLAVSEDISICGFDDVGMASWPRYNLTTYRQPLDEMTDVVLRLVAEGQSERAVPAEVHLEGGDFTPPRGSGKCF